MEYYYSSLFTVFIQKDSLVTDLMGDKRPRQRITISLDEEALKSISAIASENDISIARVVRYAVDNFLKEWKEGSQVQLFLPLSKRKGG